MELSEKDVKEINAYLKTIQTYSALVEAKLSKAFLDGVGTVQKKQSENKKASKQTKIEEIRNKAKKRFS